MNPVMRVFFVLCTALLATYRCAQGNTRLQNFEEALKNFSEEELRKEDPEMGRSNTFRHPPFQCADMSPSPSVPASVEFVKAADIKVIAAMGDSLTTAIAANASTILGVPIEYRHVSWSIGGHGTYQDVITLANIVKLFNPDVLGPAPESTMNGHPTTLEQTGFNLAVTGHNSLNFSEQTRTMIDTFKNYSAMNFEEDWKLVTVLIGMNDICDYCKDKKLFSVDNFIHHMKESLQMMMDEVPRLIVNMVQILNMESLRDVQKPTLGCQLQKSFCSCLVLPEENSTELKELVKLNREFQLRLEELIHSGQFFKDDFAVVLQPYVTRTELPKLPDGTVDFSYFGPDCFHFSIKGHEELAKGLWNNMFQPEGKKDIISSLTEPVKLICPSQEHPYIYTRPKSLYSAASRGQVLLTLLTFASSLTVGFGY
ncbi:phospholipase B1, membrane-associated-like [Clupea harengus]|uniref:Phospholipase B1, membrane-associated n=1 Tax=Clupea harengus TaxID=7950 RepID=A0A8M1KIX6_CLUHA|nr:phospholipase B1, membrane-associated-like [Clupea harengus]